MSAPRMAALPRFLVNGLPGDRVSVTDRGLAYGDGLFETIRVEQGRAGLLEQHLRRLALGASALALPVDLAQLRNELEAAAAELQRGLLKLTITRGPAGRGYAIPAQVEPTRILQLSSLPDYPAANATEGVRLFPCTTRLGHQPLLAGIKHLNRLEQVLARGEWQDPAYAEGLLLDINDHPIECTMSNLFLRLDGCWVTPSLTLCGVRGVMRDYLMDRLVDEGEPVIERHVSSDELLASTEVFCCNSVFGVWPVVELAGRRWSIGVHTRQAQHLAEQALS